MSDKRDRGEGDRRSSLPAPPLAGRSESLGLAPLGADELRWRCDSHRLDFESTDDVTPISGVIGQGTAVQALRFGLATRARGQNIFVRGLSGTGRMSLLRQLLEDLAPTCPEARDRCYVRNFTQPDRPRLISLARGKGRRFKRRVDHLADFIRDDLKQAIDAEPVVVRRTALEQAVQTKVKGVIQPFEEALEAANLALVTIPMGPVVHSVLFPRIDGKPVPPEELKQMQAEGTVSDEQIAEFDERRGEFEKQLEQVKKQVNVIREEHEDAMRTLIADQARSVLGELIGQINTEFSDDKVRRFLDEVMDDVIDRRLHGLGEAEDFTRLYRVNVLHERCNNASCPIVEENTPTLVNLLGGVDREVGPSGVFISDHMMIRAGSLLQADGGYLIIDARDVLSEPGSWKVLVRTLRTDLLEIVPAELSLPWAGATLKPEPIDVSVKVILIGDAQTFAVLDNVDPDFPNLFKLLADFDSVIPRDDWGIDQYAGVLARFARKESLVPFDRSAVAALVEHGARIAARRGKLTARFGRLADLAREGSFLARRAERTRVTVEDIREAVARTKSRADLPSRRFRELLADGTIRVQTSGQVVGQINGLAVLQAGPLVYGFPARITATIGPGSAGVINIEREAALSGAIHTKGFYILGGLLRHLLRTDHPLAFDASIAFEQSYGGIDGDSASGAEICCLLSALTGVPIRQDFAMTGAIDQMGNILAVGGINEKIEGFYDTCRDIELTGEQGVIIPRSTVGDLMLRPDVVEACDQGHFAVHAVDTVHEALELLTGHAAGERGEGGDYSEGTLLALAVRRAYEYWQKAARPVAAAASAANR